MARSMIGRLAAMSLLTAALPISAQAPGERARAAANATATAAANAAAIAYRAAYDAMPDTPGSGPYPARIEENPALPGFTLYRPAGDGPKKLGLVIWGNGACSDDGASARLHLAELASHGFLVIAPGRILRGPSAPPMPAPYQGYLKTTTADMRRALDWAMAENRRKGAAWYKRIDPRQVAVSGHSCGGMQAIQLASDKRVSALMVMFSGIFPPNPYLAGDFRFDKALIDGIRTPALYVVGNHTDVGRGPALEDFARISRVPVFVAANRSLGHEGTFASENGGVAAQVAVHWLKWQLRRDKASAAWFAGEDCGLCRDPAWEVFRKGW